MTLLSVNNLATEFNTQAGPRRAIDGVSFSVERGEVLGIVGESGSGKSVTALSIMGLIDPQVGRISGGSITFDGRDLVGLKLAELQALRGKRISMVFQEPLSALNPCFTIGDQIGEVFVAHGDGAGAATRARVLELLKLVHIPDPEGILRRYPHEISGGMRQRAMIAMALAYTPDLLIADEPTTALDVTIQAQVLNLIDRLRQELKLAVILITHDIGIVAQYTDRVAVMYGGRIVETGPAETLLSAPRHPYTIGLLASVPRLGARRPGERLQEIPGTVPSITEILPGCRFASRCAHRMSRCDEQAPALVERAPGQAAACWWTEAA
ncbi:ABC transporter ATP-binding protein [Reyranella sp. CPCC 100927]|uniref:ABC transporter ATP-binding protein n=1 Tax=Reyranella sp. CPCC 100927 TaxID=2599616 RepID=UPI0011B5DBB3|nr:ABC transporter ATP-binding protein [Reyranella sp. CPCC 100927]TWT10241.1 ABC transporter ATP-binding protein [Reyranella sp. CPCC 100927]